MFRNSCSGMSQASRNAIPGFKLDDIQSYVALAACVGPWIIIKLQKVQKVQDIFVGIRPRILFSGRKSIHGYYRANELSARKLEGGFVKWKQRSAKRNREELRWRGKACVMRLSCFSPLQGIKSWLAESSLPIEINASLTLPMGSRFRNTHDWNNTECLESKGAWKYSSLRERYSRELC